MTRSGSTKALLVALPQVLRPTKPRGCVDQVPFQGPKLQSPSSGTRMKSTRIVWGLSAWAVCGLAAGPPSPQGLFDWEKVQLSPDSNHQLGDYLKFDEATKTSALANRTCRVYPGDSDWPNADAWRELNTSSNGALIKAVPISSVCYKQTTFSNYDEEKCKTLSANWFSEVDR